jgi:hypothetical protein
MIIGNGDIASVLNDREEIIFFAAGVSNSSEMRESEYERELNLLKEQDKTKCIFYFSSILIDVGDSFYFTHKRKMEQYIKDNFENYNIIRIGNISWGKNPNTFINYIRNKIKNNEPVEIRDEYKYIIDKEHLITLTDNLPIKAQNVISIFSKMAKVKDLI